jgi:hypothetical protein
MQNKPSPMPASRPNLARRGSGSVKRACQKTGDPLLRKALYMPAVVAKRHNPAIRAFCERLKANGKNQRQEREGRHLRRHAKAHAHRLRCPQIRQAVRPEI